MNAIKRILANELHHYHNLNPHSKTILQSIFYFSLASPVLSTFISAFLWRVSQSVQLVVLYNVAVYAGIPLGFYLNGRLLKIWSPTMFYFWGAVTQGIIAALLLFLPIHTEAIIMVFGFIYGLTSGFYWSNRSLFNILSVRSHQRIYFSSLIYIIQVSCNIVIPFIIGWYLVLGERTGMYTSAFAYQLLGVVVMVILLFTGLKIKNLSIEHTPIPYTTLKKPSREWKKVRLMTFLLGITNSIDLVFPTLLILIFIGQEGRLGTIQALSGIFLAAALYQIARKVGKDSRYFVLMVGIFLSILAGCIFGMWYSPLGVLCYFILSAFATPIRWTIVSPVSFDMIDGEARRYSKNRYAFIFDQEFFLDLGRLTSLLTFITLYALAPTQALRFAPLFFALPQLGILYLAASLEEHLLFHEVAERTLVYNHVMAVYAQSPMADPS